MKPLSFEYSASLARKSGSNFYWSFFFLPREKRQAILTIYAFSRLVDDAVDEAGDAKQAENDIKLWRERLALCYQGLAVMMALPDEDLRHHPLLPELAVTIDRFQIPRAYFEDLITGMEMDLAMDARKTRYETFSELEKYCYHVASTIGLLCNHLFGYPEDEAALRYAVLLGKAFQLTNILRDVGKDAQIGRVYLPQQELRQFSLSESDILEGRSSENFLKFMNFQADRAEDFFQRSFAALPEGKRKKILPAEIMAVFYHEILFEIRRRSFSVLGDAEKVSLSKFKKIVLLIRVLLRSVL
jgi:phytoene synthase